MMSIRYSPNISMRSKIRMKEIKNLETIASDQGVAQRLVEWALTNYMKRHPVYVMLDDGEIVEIHSSYKLHQHEYGRNLFDIFRRKASSTAEILRGDVVVFRSTVAQISFIDWALRVNLYKYIRNYKKSLDSHNKITVERVRALRRASYFVTILLRWVVKHILNKDLTSPTPNKRRLLIKNKKTEIFAGTKLLSSGIFFDTGNK